MDNQLKINAILRTIGTLETSIGLKHISNASSEFKTEKINLSEIDKSLNLLGITSVAMDAEYFTTSWENWEKILDTVWGIVKNFKWTAEKFDCKVPNELAWTYGLFFADGSCGLNKKGGNGGAFWRIVNANKEYLERAKLALDWEYRDTITFRINEYNSYQKGKKTNLGTRKKNLYCLDAYLKDKTRRYNSSGTRGEFVKRWKEMFYCPFTGLKIPPKPLFDIYTEPIKYFIEGLMAGDGIQSWKSQTPYISMNIKNKYSVYAIDWFLFALNWSYRVQKFPKEFRIYISKKSLRNPPKAKNILCDNRSAFVTVLCGLLFGVNTCAGVYCHRQNIDSVGYNGLHWANLIIDNNGNTHLFDVDNHGLRQKITTNNSVMGREKYNLKSVRIY
jgi:hypothetical protein